MSPRTFAPVLVIKEIGQIEYRIADSSLPPAVRRACIRRNVENLIAELTSTPKDSAKFGGILERLHDQHTSQLEIIAGCALLRSLIPLTLGCLPAGTAFRIPEYAHVWIKRKGGVQRLDSDFIHPHFPADMPVVVINL